MNKIKLTALAVLGVFTLSGCFSPSQVDAGTEGVMVKKPYIFGHGGVDETPLKTGLTWTVWSTEVKRINIKPFNIDEKFDDLVTQDNNRVDFKIHLTFKHIAGKTPILVENFGNNWYRNKVREPLRNSTRSFTKTHKMFEMTTDSEVTDKLEEMVTKEIRQFLKDEKIPTELVLATVGRVMPPAKVIAATEETAVQEQNVKTQNERVAAEQSRENAERAAAKADRAYMNEMGMTPQEYLQMKKLENERLAIEGASSGKINMSLILGNAQPIFNVK